METAPDPGCPTREVKTTGGNHSKTEAMSEGTMKQVPSYLSGGPGEDMYNTRPADLMAFQVLIMHYEARFGSYSARRIHLYLRGLAELKLFLFCNILDIQT